jgi:7-carboxy-7-deazaguanine synthase
LDVKEKGPEQCRAKPKGRNAVNVDVDVNINKRLQGSQEEGEEVMRISEIYPSIDGEANYWGPGGFTIFVRFAGCHFNCWYCDTRYAIPMDSGTEMPMDKIFKVIDSYKIKKVTITGGEPLLQRNIVTFVSILLKNGYRVSIETSGSKMRGFEDHENLSMVYDYKTIYADQMIIEPDGLTERDVIKFVIGTLDHYLIVKKYVIERCKNTKARLYFSPVFGRTEVSAMISDMMEDELFKYGVGVNVQIHKIIWPDCIEYPKEEASENIEKILSETE